MDGLGDDDNGEERERRSEAEQFSRESWAFIDGQEH